MRLDLTVTHAPDIKSKQPWPRLAWLGKQIHDLLLLDSHRIKVLCLNGKHASKKKIAKLQSHLSHLVASNISPDGSYLVCLLESGNLLIYQKDSDALKTVPGIDQLATQKAGPSGGKTASDKTPKSSPSPHVFISSDANHILVVTGQRQLFVWEIDQSGLLSSAKQHVLSGSWSCVDCEGATLPGAECKETSIHAMFFRDSVLGRCCTCSLVFNHRSSVQISSVFLHWLEPYHIYTASQAHFSAQWSSLSYPLADLSESAEPVRHRGAFLSRHARSGQTLAVVVNQRSPADTRLLFVSVTGSTAVSANLRGCGCRKDKIRTEKTRSYWLADIAWTPDDLFLACITKQGCLSLLSRLGEAVLIQSSGCSVEHEPGLYLPFHPLVTFIPTSKHRTSSIGGNTKDGSVSPTSSLRSEADEKRQRYSLAAHPSQPLLLLSDGYLVTVIELPSGLSCAGVVRDFLSEGRTAVNLLLERQGLGGRRLRSLSSLQLRRTLLGSQGPGEDPSGRSVSLGGAGPQGLSLTRDGLLSTAGSDFTDYAARFSHVEEGHFVYSDPVEMEGTRFMTLRSADGLQMITSRAQKALLSAWGLAVSHTGELTLQMEDLLQYTARTLVKLISVVLQAAKDSLVRGDEGYVSALYGILSLFRVATTVLHWDAPHRHSLPTAFRLIGGTVRAILRHGGHRHSTTAPHCCVSILQYSEKLLTNIYSLTRVHQPTLGGLRRYSYHRADIVEGALMCQDGVRIRGTMDVDDHEIGVAVRPEETGGSRERRGQREMKARGVAVRHTPAKRLIKTWKLLHRHLASTYRKLLKDSSTRGSRGVRRVVLLLCGVQLKLRQLGCNVSLSLSDEWSRHIDAGFLRGCRLYLQGYPEEAVACWQRVAHQAKELQSKGALTLPSNRYLPGQSLWAGHQRSKFPSPGSSALLSYSLLAIVYTHLEQYNLVAAMSLVDSLIECYTLETQDNGRGRRRERGRWNQLVKSRARFLGRAREEGEAHPQLPCVPDPVQRKTVQSLARFMALYFTNHRLFVYPPCVAKPMPLLHLQTSASDTGRTVPIYHDRISSSVRQQQLSDVWTADTAMALLLVCGLLPEAVWLARELGDWKSALMLSVLARQQMESEMVPDKDTSPSQMLSLPENLTPLVIVKEGISVILQTPLTSPSPGGGNPVKRNSSFNEQDRRGSHSLSVSGGMRRSSSVCSINEEDRIMQEQLSRSLTDMLTAATVAGLDPTSWLLSNLMDRCLSLVAEFNTLVPEEFYLPAPPFYCPQPDYEPKDSDPEEVLFESSLRREVNDVIQLILLVLNSAKCSLPAARWYAQQLDLLATMEARKKKVSPTPLPSVLADHARFPVDLLKTGIDSSSLPSCTVQLLRVFRDLCTTVWMLHSRDKLTLAVRKYQASRERSLRVKPQNSVEVAKHSQLLQDILTWADNLHPFSSFLALEEEVQDILLTAISELPPTKKTVAILARHFHGNVSNLSPLLQEKFQRLMEKLKRKRELSVRKTAKRKVAEAEKENKRVVKYDTLHRHYQYECKQRKLAVSSRQEDIGLCELQVFEELSEKASRKEAEDKEDAEGEATHSSGAPTTSTAKQSGTAESTATLPSLKEEDLRYPHVGSREFESSAGYLDFLETFFLVAFGKIMQESAPFSNKPKVPLLGAYSSELRKKEFASVIRRMSGNTKPPTVELDSSSIRNLHMVSMKSTPQSLDEITKNKTEEDLKEEQSKPVKSRSMFQHRRDLVEGDAQVISLRKHGSRSSLISQVDPNKEKTSASPASQSSNVEPSLSKQGILQPYSAVVLNLGEEYKSKAELLQWFGRWAERQLAVYAQTPGQADKESKAVLRVRLPQQLVLNSLWLVRQLYHSDLFENHLDLETPAMLTTAQEEGADVPFGLSSQLDKSNQARNLIKERRGDKKYKGNLRNERPDVERHKKSKARRPSRKKKQQIDDALEVDGSDEERSSEDALRSQKNITEKRRKKTRSASGQSNLVKQEESVDSKPRKRRQLPEVTQAHRDTSPRHGSANKKAINQLLLRAKHASAMKGSRLKPSLNESCPSDLSEGGGTSASISTSQAAISSDEDRNTGPTEKRFTDPSHRSRKDGTVSEPRRGIIRNDVFYYSDRDTSSTLDISSLDEAEGTALGETNWLLDAQKDIPMSPEADAKEDESLLQQQQQQQQQQEQQQQQQQQQQQERSTEETPLSLNLNMKDADVKRLVREEFMRIMMEKTNSKDLNGRSAQIKANSPEPSQVHEERQQQVSKEQQSAGTSAGKSRTSTQQSAHQGIDAETQAPSPLLQTWHGDAPSQRRSIPPLATSQDISPAVFSRQSEQTTSGWNQLGLDRSCSERPASQVTGIAKIDFKPDLHSTAYDADLRWPRGERGAVSGFERAAASQVIQDEPEMPPLSLQDLEGEDNKEDRNHFVQHSMKQRGPYPVQGYPQDMPNSVSSAPRKQQYSDSVDRSDHPAPPTYQSTFRFPMQIPLLLTVPQERLAQGALGAAGTRYPPPPQGMDPSQGLGPPLISRPAWESVAPAPGTDSVPWGTRSSTQQYPEGVSQYRQSHLDSHSRKADFKSMANPAIPRPAQTAPPANRGFIPPIALPPTAYEHPVNHFLSVLHPGAQKPHPQYGTDTPPIPLLHMESKYPLPSVPLPTNPHAPSINPGHLPNPMPSTHSNPGNPLPLLKLQTDAKAPPFVPLEELDAFERRQRREQEKHRAVTARKMRECMEGGKEERGPEIPAPMPLLHADLKNDLANSSRLRRRQQQEQKPPHPRANPADIPGDKPQKEQRNPGDKPQSRRGDTEQRTGQTRKEGEVKSRKIGRGSKAVKTRVILVEESAQEHPAPTDSSKRESTSDTRSGESSDDSDSEHEEREPDKQEERRRREDLGSGYAIKPGSFDSMLQDRNARPAIPTPAQVHYDAVQQLQAKPKTRTDAGRGVKETKNVATSMGKDDFPHRPPTVAEATSQYTAAATGLAATGQIVAPDIFFNLRFGSSTSHQQPSLQDKETGKDTAPAGKGRSFISVVDIDLKDVPSPPPELPPKDHQQQPSALPKPEPTPPSETQEGRAPSPTNAELHYSALFLKDAHPKRTPPKVQFEDEKEMAGGPDAVTLKVLERKTKADSRRVAQSEARSESARQSTKAKLSERLAQMDQQLNAIEESAANIEQDFRNTSLMLHTVENLADAMAPGDTRPKADYSFRGYREPYQLGIDLKGADGPGARTDDGKRSQDITPAEEHKEADGDEGQKVAMVTEDSLTGIDRGEDSALTLGISGMSGVSDIIAEVIAEGDASDAREMGISARQQKAAKKRMEQRRVTEQPRVQDYGRLSSDKIRELLETPRTPRPDEEEDDHWPSRRKPAERSEKERKELQEWAAKKRAKSLAEYKKQRGEMIEKEHKPYQSKGGESVGPASMKEIRKQEHVRDKKKKEILEESHAERVQAAKALMAEIFTEKPQLPADEAPPPSRTGRRDRVAWGSETEADRLDVSGLSLGSERRQGGQVRGGTYMFIDSGAYTTRPASGTQRGGTGRIDLRASRGAEVSYNTPQRQRGERGSSRAGGLRPEGREAREQISRRRDDDFEGRGPETGEDWIIPEGISEIGDGEAVREETRSETKPTKLYKPKPFDQVVRVQRPEVTRKKPGTARTQKTYTEMLQEMKGETNKRRSASRTLKAKQRLYGTTRIPGSARAPGSTTPRVTETYSERLSGMQQKSGGQTRLRPRTRPMGVPKINTATMTFSDGPYRRQEVEGRGLHPEPTPRSSTPYHERHSMLSVSGTHRGRDDVVSPAPKVGVRYKPREREPMTYVERLQRASLEAPRTHRHKIAYVGPVQRETYKSPPLRSPTTRHQPYPRQGQRSPGVEEWDERSGLSDLSSWNVSDEVRNILQRRDSYEGDLGEVTDDDISIGGLEYDDYAASVNVKELEDIASVGSGSVLSNIDWSAVDKMIADVH